MRMWTRAELRRLRFRRVIPPACRMTWNNHTVVFCLWCSQPVLQSVVAAILWRRKLHKQFPVFFMFLLAQIANFVIIFPAWRASKIPVTEAMKGG